MNVADVQVFNKVALTKSFQDAGELLGMSRSAVSKRISRLEEELGVVLLNRSSRSASLTEAGRTFLEHTIGVDETVERAAQSVRGLDQRPSGTVACSVPSSLAAAITPALIKKFHAAWPDLNLGFHFHDGPIDMISEGFDVAIRVADKLNNSNLVSRRLGNTRCMLVASPGYLKKHGTPASIQELKQHRCLALGKPTRPWTTWYFGSGEDSTEIRIHPAVTGNNYLALILAACLDDGILFLPEIYVGGELAHGRLQAVLPDQIGARSCGIYAVTPSRNPPAKTRVLIEFFAGELEALCQVDRWAPFAET